MNSEINPEHLVNLDQQEKLITQEIEFLEKNCSKKELKSGLIEAYKKQLQNIKGMKEFIQLKKSGFKDLEN